MDLNQVAWELLWNLPKQTQKRLHDLFEKNGLNTPNELVLQENIQALYSNEYSEVVKNLPSIDGVKFTHQGCSEYPEGLYSQKYPLRGFYSLGSLDTLNESLVSVIGSRECTNEGIIRTKRLTSHLIEDGYTIVSGLAKGIDTIALTESINNNGKVIGVIGTPITEFYPPENKSLQDEISQNHLLISQLPFVKSSNEHYLVKKQHFVERNATMSAISKATIIVEAKDGSGTLTQGKACLDQGRKLFILKSCLENNQKWVEKFLKKGAIILADYSDFIEHIGE